MAMVRVNLDVWWVPWSAQSSPEATFGLMWLVLCPTQENRHMTCGVHRRTRVLTLNESANMKYCSL